MKVLRNDLERFLKKLNKIKSLKPENLVETIAEHGKKIAEFEYSAGGFMPAISVEANGKRADIVFQHEALAFHEFGTGAYAQYPDQSKLPQSGVPITGSWQYYYDSPYKVTIGGKMGWFYGATFTTGTPAHAEIFYTAQALKDDIPYIVKDLLWN